MCARVTSTYMEFTFTFGPKPEFKFSFKFAHLSISVQKSPYSTKETLVLYPLI